MPVCSNLAYLLFNVLTLPTPSMPICPYLANAFHAFIDRLEVAVSPGFRLLRRLNQENRVRHLEKVLALIYDLYICKLSYCLAANILVYANDDVP